MNRLSLPLWSFLVALTALLVWPVSVLAQGATGGETTPLDQLSTYALWSIVGGAITSGVTALINQSQWKSVTKLAVFLVLCCVTAGINAHFNRTLDLSDWSRSLLLVIASGWTTYLMAKGAIKQVEVATTLPTKA